MTDISRISVVTSVDDIAALARQLRVDSIRMSTGAGSGHPTSSLSAADLMAVLLARHLRVDWADSRHGGNDHLIFSKGHASPLLYAMFKAAGVVSDDELMTRYRRVGSPWMGHPTPALPWVDVATGSLGQGLPVGVGIALAGQFLERADYHVWVLCGDSEMAEGSMWEALDKAGHFGLGNLTAIVDVNELGMRGPTALGWDLERYAARVRAFGCHPVVVDGHDIESIDAALRDAREDRLPTVVLARTVKGRGVPELEDRNGWHGKPLPRDMAARAIAHLGGQSDLRIQPNLPTPAPTATHFAAHIRLPEYPVGEPVSTRSAYGQALVALGADPRVVVVDAEVGNSTRAELFDATRPERYFDVFTAEQQMIAAAVGFSVRGYVPYAATFAAFLTRAHDFIRMAAISAANIRLVGSHAGVEVGPDGSSQMALEDLAMMRSVHGSTVLYPSDANSAARLTEAMRVLPGISYLRTTRGAYPVLYDAHEAIPDPRVEGRTRERTRRRNPHRRRRDRPQLHRGRAAADRQWRAGPGARRVLDQTARRRRHRRRRRRHRRPGRRRRGPPPRGRAGRGGLDRARRRRARRCSSHIWQCATCRRPDRPTNSCARPASPPSISRTPRRACSAPTLG